MTTKPDETVSLRMKGKTVRNADTYSNFVEGVKDAIATGDRTDIIADYPDNARRFVGYSEGYEFGKSVAEADDPDTWQGGYDAYFPPLD